MRSECILFTSELDLKLALFLIDKSLNTTLDDPAEVEDRLELILGTFVKDGR